MIKKIDIDQPEILHTSFENFKRSKNPIRSILSDQRIIYKSEDTRSYNMFDFYNDYFSDSFLSSKKKPFILLHACFSMPWLEKVIYDKETQNYLNETGLDIYLLETLFLYNGANKRIYRDLLISPEDGIPWDELKITFEDNEKDISSFELDSIEFFIKNNNLRNVTVYVEEYQADNFFSNRYKNFKILSKPLFHLAVRGICDENSIKTDNINKKFICLNRRYDYHRHIISSFLYDKDCILGWDHRNTFEDLKKSLWFDIEKWDNSNLEIIKNNARALCYDPPGMLEKDLTSNGTCPSGLPLPIYEFQRAFCYIINESYFAYPFGLIDEKVMNSVLLKKPFLLVGPAKSLEYFKSFGFKTFSAWWDESYDNVNNHEERLLKILDLISHINSLSLIEIRKIYNDMKSTLEYNLDLSKKIKKIQ